MEKLRKMPIGIQDFESLRRDGYLYVDKTRQIYRLISTGRYYFLSRPRRFGKSLLLSTVKAFYKGKKELFDGTVGYRLAIADLFDATWEKYPVLHLDLNTEEYKTGESLISVLNENLVEWETLYGKNKAEKGLGRRFQGVIRRASEQYGRKTVILVDEYDKPLLQAIGNAELQETFRSTLKGFYGALKSMDEYIQFAMLTGVTKFGKSIFSDLNNLEDISMDATYWNICGLCEDELETYFREEISQLAEANGMTFDECISTLRTRYDGYHFEESPLGVYNPFSVLNTFKKNKFGSYWFETGTPSYLVKLLQEHGYNLETMSSDIMDAETLNNIDAASKNPIPVIYQSGYLTIKGYDRVFKNYRLGFPNAEVEEGFLYFLLPYYTSIEKGKTTFAVQQLVNDVRAGRVERFLARLKSLFADTPYELVRDLENHYQNVLWLVAKLMGFYVQAEYHTSSGRIDMVLQVPEYCYVMEFKLDGTAEEALKQISDRQYALPFEVGERKVVKVGLNFDSSTRNIDSYVIG